MDDVIKTRSTSSNTTEVSPIVLRENTITRLVFEPLIINDNPNDPDAHLKGSFIFQRKGPYEQWEDIKAVKLSNLKKGEGYELTITSEELNKLIQKSKEIFELYKIHGFSYGEKTYTVTEGNIGGVFLQISDLDNKEWIIKNLKQLEQVKLENLQLLIGSAKLNRILDEWHKNKTNTKEIYWQKLFEENVWVLQQIFAYSVIILQGETYVGGKNTKGRSGRGGVATDFLGQNQSTNSFVVVEIKTPSTDLVGNIYRGEVGSEGANETYAMSEDLSGGIVQLENQIETAINNFKETLGADFNNENMNHLDPHGVLMIGNLENLTSTEKKSFFLFRTGVKDITIVTFDEVFQKVEMLKNIFNE